MTRSRSNFRRGFTIIEVTLVLAISSLLVISIMTGITTSITRQRYNDAVNDLVDYLRSSYSEAINVQNSRLSDTSGEVYCSVTTMFNEYGKLTYYDNQGNPVDSYSANHNPGRTNCAIYGRLVTFGEWDNNLGRPSSVIHAYDIIGRVYSPDSSVDEKASDDLSVRTRESEKSGYSFDNETATLRKIGANVVSVASSGSACSLAPAGNTSVYSPQWGTRLETGAAERRLLRGALLIIRSPLSGTIHTYFSDYSGDESIQGLPIDVSNALSDVNYSLGGCSTTELETVFSGLSSSFLAEILTSSDPSLSNTSEVTICVDSDDLSTLNNRRRAIQIRADGHNATAVELLNADAVEGEYPCR